ncbi:MMPL family transporter [Aeromicrobium ginsengisoli]|uniref:MMPL family transporter n=1 Tax=Aeromicrobium ginsengisoli TaxID=363867 RepID=A0A5M4FHS1_9ACTN|nr:MMPL family transporter [Aeromicrobium ginsengisoli]KAA1399518.1 MMPL family transporter [Aeromicrobium ginsengisoli]
MFSALGRFVTRRPWIVLGTWVALAVVVITTAPGLTATTDEAEFLPKHYESIKAANLQEKAFPSQGQPGAILVFDRKDGGKLTAEDSAKVESVVDELNGKLDKAFVPGTVQPPSDNKLVQIAVVGLADNATGYDTQSMDAAKDLRKDAKPLVKDTGLQLRMTGAAPQSVDSEDSSAKTMEIVGLATIVLIVVLLALIFHSVIICLLPIVVVTLVSFIATGLIAWANDIFDLKADSSIQVILIVVLYGIGTDYILFLLFRYRERLRTGEDTKIAIGTALERAGEAIASAGGAVIVSFMALVLSSLSIFRSIGPALAIAVAVTLLAALTLVPALLTLLGRALFWPSKKWRDEPAGTRFASIGTSLGKHPVRFAGAAGLLLAVLASFTIGFNPSFDFNSSLPKDVESTKAIKTLEKGLPAGVTDPTTVLLSSDNKLDQTTVDAFAADLGRTKGIAQVSPGTLSEDGRTAVYNALLDHDPTSDAAIADVKGPIRDAAHEAAPEGTEAFVGGTTSVFVDMQKAMNRDYSIVFPVAAVVIMIILALLLRSLVAPLYLMVSVGLGFGATLGATVIVFQHIQGLDGLIFMLPIYIYLFVVALGTDYNILMIARLREEAREGRSPRDAAAQAVRHAGPTIAAAGVILAGTFAALMLGGNSLITSMGFALSFGIFVAAFVMAMFLTPALTALIGHAAWWPGHGDETEEEKAVRVDARG